jgi:hypothetical protein
VSTSTADPAYRIEDTGEGAWTLFANEPTRSPAGTPLDTGRVVEVFIGETAEEVAETTCRILNEEATRGPGEPVEVEPEVTETIAASSLRKGFRVKAPGAPAWSTIRGVDVDAPARGKITARFDWGALIYDEDEDAEVLVTEAVMA